MGLGAEELLRITPWFLTILCANVVHYGALWTARDEDRKRVIAQRKKAEEDDDFSPKHELLTFDLMQSPIMRKARYKVKLLRYLSTTLYLLLFHRFIAELHEPYRFKAACTLECLIVGTLSGLITVYLNENQDEAMRTLWRPGHDFGSRFCGDAWDVLRLVGATAAVPVEEELFYHSLLYRYVVTVVRGRHGGFADVGFREWSWTAWLLVNGVRGVYNGKEWRSRFVSGLLFGWMVARRGAFLDGVAAHAVSNLTVACWVLGTGQRQYW